MPYVYRCRQCRASSPPGPRPAAEEYRQEHRDTRHGGLVPDGEHIRHVPGSTRHPDGRYVPTGGVWGLLAALAAAEAVIRWFGS